MFPVNLPTIINIKATYLAISTFNTIAVPNVPHTKIAQKSYYLNIMYNVPRIVGSNQMPKFNVALTTSISVYINNVQEIQRTRIITCENRNVRES